MAPVPVPTDKLFEFATFDAFYAWLRDNHASVDEVWIRIFKKGAGKPAEASSSSRKERPKNRSKSKR